MIKLKAFIISIVLVLITLLILNETYIKKIDDYYKVKDNSIRYNISYEKYKSYDILTQNITSNTLVLLGSSELTATINEGYHPKKIFNYDDFNIMQIGEGHFQNIIHAATLGSIGSDVKNNKVVIIESIQWFDNKNGILKDAFLSRISEEHVYRTMVNEKISQETKEKFINRIIELSITNKEMHKKFKNYKKYFIDGKGSFVTGEFLKFDNYIYSFKNKYDSLKNISKNTRYEDSPEYKDLDIFLSIAKDLGVNLKIAIFPSHGKWSDYSGITQETRSVVYTKLKDIAKKYNIEVMDYSNKEYESYFMYDVMHLGWRGWIDFERDLYKFAKEN